MDVIVRKVFKHGRSLAITFPRRWNIPEVLHVYSNKMCIVYSSLAGLETMYKITRISIVKRRIARTGKNGRYIYYMVTIPRRVALELGIKQGTIITVIRRMIYGEPVFIGLVGEEALVKAISGYMDWMI